ncbi:MULTISPECIES: T9SS type A sorting domain-containing protein [unclassified Polaribacter]|uniref:T9SS type A sorting domain-containing protein n=1 Tax=unclassified Polaribacter TaxID=196858 RepID=UPI0011BDA0F7|nr:MULTISPECIES: T9SS type A sorting domain-containing protein [unclassified Polaribacter]TXD53141.1 T9SS type A sorting domain-containing protein [Polaribacter sp. IC063]TXD61261.1 T9SS type A sorting domain-containing protein [Polaribacter sp. IC066]
MKKSLHVFLLFFTIMAFGQVTLPVIEQFDYSIGRGLTEQENWRRAGGTNNPTDIMVVASPNWTIPNTTTPRENAVSLFGTGLNAMFEFVRPEGTPTIYASFMMKVTNMDNITGEGNSFASLALNNSSDQLTRNCSVFIRQHFTGTGYNIGISQGQNGTEIWNDAVYSLDEEVLIVIKKESQFSGLRFASIFINPDLTAAEPAATRVTGDRFGTPDRFVLDQNRGDLPTIVIDELRIADTWSDVTLSAPSSVEEAKIAVYPNPVFKGTLFVNAASNVSIEIYSVLGKKVLAKSNVSKSVDVSNLAKGCYILKMKDENNAVKTKKLIIQ